MSSFCKCKSYSHFFSKNISAYAIFNDQSFKDTLINNINSFEQLGPDFRTFTIQVVAISSSVLLFVFQAWNPASEDQCFDRCHRLGQTKDVIITKVPDTVGYRGSYMSGHFIWNL